ncbi:non-specific lipid transfer protein GPI-anchored 19-like [Phoenix dactylifera]|uniref:Non-specific lipid transfer protein GPI-anchored 19-like n=1 Tax=Phoenix dactylifera TaxID=42345 RepID=A0A8B8J0M5_PHODC|nr:non-specific lipid transfer protein GPI-anchored 19-like [Phoenix dactylifera]
MARRGIELGLALVLMAMLYVQASAQTSCTPAIASLSPCLGFITGNSSTPSSSCCSLLAGVVQTQAPCLCAVLNGAAAQQLGTIINQTQALNLPNVCNIQTPSISSCNALSRPAAAPTSQVSPSAPSVPDASSPTAALTPSVPDALSPGTPSTPSVSSIPSGTGSKTVPTTGQSSAATSSAKATPAFLFFLLLVGSYASTFSTS